MTSGLLFGFSAFMKVDVLPQRPKGDANNVRNQIGAIERIAKHKSAETSCANRINPMGVTKLQKLNGPRKTNSAQSDSDRRASPKNESETEKHNERPKRISPVFRRRTGKRNKARAPKEAHADD